MVEWLTMNLSVAFVDRALGGAFPRNTLKDGFQQFIMLAPLLRMDQDGINPKTLISLEGEALMEETRLPIGSQIPIALKVYIVDPRAFFELFQNQDDAANTNANQFFVKSKSKKGRLPAVEAATVG
jgi:hypothetical protein